MDQAAVVDSWQPKAPVGLSPENAYPRALTLDYIVINNYILTLLNQNFSKTAIFVVFFGSSKFTMVKFGKF